MTHTDVAVAETPADGVQQSSDAAGDAARAVLGLLVFVGGILVLVDAASLRVPAGQSAVGPAAFPTAVGVLLILGGAALAVVACKHLRGRRAHVPGRGVVRLLLALALLFGHAMALPHLGYVVCTATLFAGMALLLGGTRRLRAVLAGVGFAVVVFVAFVQGIGLVLPTGPWGF